MFGSKSCVKSRLVFILHVRNSYPMHGAALGKLANTRRKPNKLGRERTQHVLTDSVFPSLFTFTGNHPENIIRDTLISVNLVNFFVNLTIQ